MPLLKHFANGLFFYVTFWITHENIWKRILHFLLLKSDRVTMATVKRTITFLVSCNMSREIPGLKLIKKWMWGAKYACVFKVESWDTAISKCWYDSKRVVNDKHRKIPECSKNNCISVTTLLLSFTCNLLNYTSWTWLSRFRGCFFSLNHHGS